MIIDVVALSSKASEIVLSWLLLMLLQSKYYTVFYRSKELSAIAQHCERLRRCV